MDCQRNPGDSARFTLDDLEKYLETQNDLHPLYYLIDKYVKTDDRIEQLEKELDKLKKSRG